MKKENLILLAALGVGVFAISRYLQSRTRNAPMPAPRNSGVVAPNPDTAWVSEITRSDGWTYYTDGTVIGPSGEYYNKGTLVYDPRGMYQ